MAKPAGKFAKGWVNSTLIMVIPVPVLTLSPVMLFCVSACAGAANAANIAIV